MLLAEKFVNTLRCVDFEKKGLRDYVDIVEVFRPHITIVSVLSTDKHDLIIVFSDASFYLYNGVTNEYYNGYGDIELYAIIKEFANGNVRYQELLNKFNNSFQSEILPDRQEYFNELNNVITDIDFRYINREIEIENLLNNLLINT